MKVLTVNVFFDPLTFGGATIVAEQVAGRLYRDHGMEMVALSSRRGTSSMLMPVRYTTRFGFPGYLVHTPAPEDYVQAYDNAAFARLARDVLDVERPDVVHVHCVQEIGTRFLDLLAERGIPYVVTVHDFWWLCERQFMIDVRGNHCGQWRIDPAVCRRCNRATGEVAERLETLLSRLNRAKAVLTPSRFVADQLIANGVGSDRVTVNRNGVLLPTGGDGLDRTRPRELAGRTVFGFVGDPGPIKGWDLVRRAFEKLDREDAALAVVDSGFTRAKGSSREMSLAGRSPLVVLPAYTAETIDRFFAQIDVLLCPSRAKETFGMAAREATARDVWVIASDAGGLSENIQPGRNGTVLPFPPSEADLRAAIRDRIARTGGALPGKERVQGFDQQAREVAGLLRERVDAARPAPAAIPAPRG